MIARSISMRRRTDLLVKTVSGLSALMGVAALGWILWIVTLRGIGAINLAFFTELPTPPGVPGGGLANAIIGTLLITLLASIMGIAVGLFAGVYLSEFGRKSAFASWVRLGANVLMGTPSIIIGVFVYGLMVVRVGHFSGYAGAVALAIIMVPVVTRTTEDMLMLVPNELRESALALGALRWKMTIDIVFRAAKSGLLTGVLRAVARVSGETAPLLFTALNSPYYPQSLNAPTANLTVTIFNYAMSPYADWQRMAWGASFLIMAGVLLMTVTARLFLREKKRWI